MSESSGEPTELDEMVETLIEDQGIIINNQPPIENIFSDIITADKIGPVDNWGNKINVVLKTESDQEYDPNIPSILINTVLGFDEEIIETLREHNSDEDLISFLSRLHTRYSEDATRNLQRSQRGDRWWSNIRTQYGLKGNRPQLTHEIVIDQQEVMRIDSEPSASLELARHILRYVYRSVDDFGIENTSISEDGVEEVATITAELMDELDLIEEDTERHADEVISEREENSESAENRE